MSSLQDFQCLVRWAKRFGILSTTYHRRTLQLRVTKFDIIFELLAVVIICFGIVYSAVFYFLLLSWKFYGDNITGHSTLEIQLIVMPALRLIELFWTYFNRKRNLKLLQGILTFLKAQQHLDNYLTRLRNFFPLVLIVVLSVNVILHLFRYRGLATEWPFLVIVEIFSSIQTAHICFLLWFYACLIIWIGCLIEECNKDLVLIIRFESNRLKSFLRKRLRLLDLCLNEVNKIYGITFIIITLHLFMGMPTIPFLILEYIVETKIVDGLKIFYVLYLSLFPIIALSVTFVIALMANDLESKANKTARILSRLSKRGTGMEKMVDKFLIKNMQQKPILTAYGFFPLNKQTLFKIFAAIVTYMVILIQFKDMENTSKPLSSGPSPSAETITSTTTIS